MRFERLTANRRRPVARVHRRVDEHATSKRQVARIAFGERPIAAIALHVQDGVETGQTGRKWRPCASLGRLWSLSVEPTVLAEQ
jgi:hypothetical protein